MKFAGILFVIGFSVSSFAQSTKFVVDDNICMGRQVDEKQAINMALSQIDPHTNIRSIELDIPSLAGSKRIITIGTSKGSFREIQLNLFEVAYDCSGETLSIEKL